MKKRILTLFTFHFLLSTAFSQNQQRVDTLEARLKKHNAHKLELRLPSPSLYDTTAVEILNALYIEHRGSDLDKAMNYINQCLVLSEQIGYKKGIGNAYSGMGTINTLRGDYLAALDFNKKALEIRLEIGDKRFIAGSYNDIGIIYYNQANYPEALKNYYAALKLKEEVRDKQGVANAYSNIGNIYSSQENYTEALKSYYAGLKIYQEMGIKHAFASSYANIGATYADMGNHPDALKNFFAALKIQNEIGNTVGISETYSYIGESYRLQDNYPEALKNLFTALKIKKELGDKFSMAFCLVRIGYTYTAQKKYSDASKYFNDALPLLKEVGDLDLTSDYYYGIAKLDSAQGNFNKAFANYKLYIAYRDSVENTENTEKMVALQMNYEFDKKQDSLNVVQAKKDFAAQKALNKQILVRNRFIAGTIILLLLAGAVIKFYIDRMKRNRKKQMEAVRAGISRDLHDDMGSTLQSISVMSELARMKSSNTSESIPILEKIGNASREMMDKMSDIVWAVSPQNDNFENIILHMRAFGGELLAGKDIALHFKSDSGLNSIILSMEKRKSFFLVYKEALNNAYKYSGAKNVKVEISKTNNSLKLTVEDDGVGFNMNEDRLKTGGNGLKNMKSRAAELNGNILITSEPGQGTKVSLTVKLS